MFVFHYLCSLSTGLAGDVTFTSDPKGPNYDRYQLVWSAQSNTPITRFR